MKREYLAVAKRGLLLAGMMVVFASGSAFAQNQAIGFKQGMPFSNGYVAAIRSTSLASGPGYKWQSRRPGHRRANDQHNRCGEKGCGRSRLQDDGHRLRNALYHQSG